jgi:hypothetical protein
MLIAIITLLQFCLFIYLFIHSFISWRAFHMPVFFFVSNVGCFMNYKSFQNSLSTAQGLRFQHQAAVRTATTGLKSLVSPYNFRTLDVFNAVTGLERRAPLGVH